MHAIINIGLELIYWYVTYNRKLTIISVERFYVQLIFQTNFITSSYLASQTAHHRKNFSLIHSEQSAHTSRNEISLHASLAKILLSDRGRNKALAIARLDYIL